MHHPARSMIPAQPTHLRWLTCPARDPRGPVLVVGYKSLRPRQENSSFFPPFLSALKLPYRRRSLPVSRGSNHPFFDSFCSEIRQGLTVLLPFVLQLKLHPSIPYTTSCQQPLLHTGEFPLLRFSSSTRCGLVSYVLSCNS
jgi:hypothetical protein